MGIISQPRQSVFANRGQGNARARAQAPVIDTCCCFMRFFAKRKYLVGFRRTSRETRSIKRKRKMNEQKKRTGNKCANTINTVRQGNEFPPLLRYYHAFVNVSWLLRSRQRGGALRDCFFSKQMNRKLRSLRDSRAIYREKERKRDRKKKRKSEKESARELT